MKHPCKLCNTHNMCCSDCEKYLNYLKHKSKRIKEHLQNIKNF